MSNLSLRWLLTTWLKLSLFFSDSVSKSGLHGPLPQKSSLLLPPWAWAVYTMLSNIYMVDFCIFNSFALSTLHPTLSDIGNADILDYIVESFRQ